MYKQTLLFIRSTVFIGRMGARLGHKILSLEVHVQITLRSLGYEQGIISEGDGRLNGTGVVRF